MLQPNQPKGLPKDEGLQQAFGRQRCAEQSVIQQTLDASDSSSVSQMHEAMNEIYQQHSQGYRHDYQQQLQVLDADMSGHIKSGCLPILSNRYRVVPQRSVG